jgi:mono/diheme cytochrome c family protein
MLERIGSLAMLLVLLSPALVRAAGREEGDQAARGRASYMQYCASCHGPTGDGHGPVAAVLRRPPADLRRLGERYGTPLPRDRIAAFIDGRAEVAAHGNREMPVWGERLGEVQIDGKTADETARERIAALVAYLTSIQQRGYR